jgi:CheY-like chemotaxis protein
MVIVLDNLLPGMGGIEAAGIILSKRPTQEIILCTAYLDDDLIDRARSAGVEHLRKGPDAQAPRPHQGSGRGSSLTYL